MKCFIHVGISKNDSDFIQDFFNANFNLFFKKGLFCANNIINDFDLALGFCNIKSSDFIRKSLIDEKSIKSAQFEIHDNLKELLFFSKNKNIFFSSRYLRYNLNYEDLLKLKQFFMSCGVKDFKIVTYLREPMGCITNLYCDSLIEGFTYSKVPLPDEKTDFSNFLSYACNHELVIKRFLSAFGSENIIVRKINNKNIKNHSLLRDICNILGFDHELDFPINQFRKLSNLEAELLFRINKRIDVRDTYIRKKLRKELINSFIKPVISNKPYTLNSETYHAYQELFSEPNEWVRANFFPELDVLFPKPPPPDVLDLSLSPQELDSIANLLADIWLEREVYYQK